MYFEQVVEASESKTVAGDHTGAAIPAFERRRLVDFGFIPRKIIRLLNDRQVPLENMDKLGENPEELESASVIEKTIFSSAELPLEPVENVAKCIEDVDGSGEEKCLRDEEETRDDTVDRRAGNEELLIDDNDEEGTRFFDNKLQSIFIRRSTIDCEGDKSVRKMKDLRLERPDKWIVKKDDRRTRKLKKKHALSFVDTLITLFVVAPLVIGQWRGIWSIMDLYKDYFPEWLCFIVGTSLHVVFAIARDRLHGRFVEKWRTYSWVGRVAYDFVRLVYIYVFCVACNAQWRGGWMIFTEYFGSNIVVVCLFTTLFAAALVILRAFRNLLAPPFIVIIDQPERVFNFPTRYNVIGKHDPTKNSGNKLFYTIIHDHT